MPFLYYTLFVCGIVAADQFTKYLTVANIELFQDIPFIPGLLQLTYVQNTGAAFSSFEGQQWLFAIVFVIFTGMILWEYFKKPMGFTGFERWCIFAVYGGGLEGVRVVTEKIKAELEDAMAMCGVHSLAEINRDILA